MLLLRFVHASDGLADAVCAVRAVVRAATATRAAMRVVRVLARRGSVMIIHFVVGRVWSPTLILFTLWHVVSRGP